MKMDEGFQDQKLSLDVTPLIDIIFLLVLFFAVSTSFISAEDLSDLKTDVISLGELVVSLGTEKEALSLDKRALTQRSREMDASMATLTEQLNVEADEIGKLQAELIAGGKDIEKNKWMIAKLEQERGNLRETLSSTRRDAKNLQQQLQHAYRDYKNLDVQLSGLRSDAERQANQESLLRALLVERATQSQQLEQQLANSQSEADTFKVGKNALARQLALAVGQAKKVDAERAQLESETERRAREEVLLQALIAEKAAAMAALDERLAGAHSRNRALAERAHGLQSENEQRFVDINAMRQEVLGLRTELASYKKVADLDRGQVGKILEAQRNLQAGLGEYLEDNRLGIKRERQRLILQLSDQILFNSGSAAINTGGVAVLRKVGNIIKVRSADLQVQIAGHTDNVPVGSGRGALSNNWALSAARAVNVVRLLQSDVGIDATRMSALGYGEHRPVASNDTAAGRASNRRIEIVLVPR
jgi:chemotaxis protein MotB